MGPDLVPVDDPVPARPVLVARSPDRAPLVGRISVTQGGQFDAAETPPTALRAIQQPSPTGSSAVRPSIDAVLGALSGTSGMIAASPSWHDTGPGETAAAPIVARSVGVQVAGATPTDAWSAVDPTADGPQPLRRLSAADAHAPAVSATTPGRIDLREPPSRAVLGPPIVQSLRAHGQMIRRAAASLGDAGPAATYGELLDSGSAQPEELFPPVQRATADDFGVDVESGPVVHRATEPGAPAAADAGGAAAGQSAGGGGQSEPELDELARKLFPRIQLRLRDELLIGRERIGALVDLGR